MKQRPILMSGPLVCEILSGNKTQTRRPVKEPYASYPCVTKHITSGDFDFHIDQGIGQYTKCPYGDPGDQLWIKEGYYAYGWWYHTTTKEGKTKSSFIDVTLRGGHKYIYQTEDPPDNVLKGFLAGSGWYKRNSLFMPHIASRVELEILWIGVERLQDISEEDAKAEGVKQGLGYGRIGETSYREGFFWKWIEIYGRDSFVSNPWVWVIKFRRIEQ